MMPHIKYQGTIPCDFHTRRCFVFPIHVYANAKPMTPRQSPFAAASLRLCCSQIPERDPDYSANSDLFNGDATRTSMAVTEAILKIVPLL